jgi:superfamily II DNA or RNA helicase
LAPQNKRIKEIERRLEDLDTERRNLVSELAKLRIQPTPVTDLPPVLGSALGIEVQTPEDKVQLFQTLFATRTSAYPRLWENLAKGTKGYALACANEWDRNVCGKPKIKCTDCPNQAFLRLDEIAIRDHLQGKHTIGTYTILEDDTCTFLSADFDCKGWEGDATAYRTAGREIGVPVEVERSRSGQGAHAWIFFSEKVPARLARQLGTVIMTRAQASRNTMSLDSYDRFFPNQDYMPKGGFGNLIALPLQKQPREKGNSVFLDENLEVIADQWAHLSRVKRVSGDELRMLLQQHMQQKSFSTVKFEDVAVSTAERALDAGGRKVVSGCFPGRIEIKYKNQLKINLDGLPSEIVAAFKRTATFANPKYFELERMRFSTWKTLRYIFCGEIQHDRLTLPRGCLDPCLRIAEKAGSQVILQSSIPAFKTIKPSFKGELSNTQKKAVAALTKTDIGVLVAPPGAGKTVMGCALVAKRKLPTLILVHRMPLLEQWRAQITTFLGINPKSIGTLGKDKKKKTGEIDLGMLQTLAKMEDAAEELRCYGQIIIDECHHIPAVSFEATLKKCSPKYVVGLTATPYRKDGHQSIIHMQCGPIRHEIKHVDGPALVKRVVVRETGFRMPDDIGPQPAIHLVWEQLVSDQHRLDLVANDLFGALNNGRFPLIISERKEHLALLAKAFDARLAGRNVKAFTLVGGMGKKARAAVLAEITATLNSKMPAYLMATGSLVGEGFDLPALDTLIIAMPVSFKGKLIQYAGRLHRASEGKRDALIYDYLDSSSALTVSMFKKRMSAYKMMGYQIEAPEMGGRAHRIVQGQPSLFEEI